jgi:hypothetical protein
VEGAAVLDDRIESLAVGGRSGDKCKRQGYRREGTVPGLGRIATRETLPALVAPRPLRLVLEDEPVTLGEKVFQLYGAGSHLMKSAVSHRGAEAGRGEPGFK